MNIKDKLLHAVTEYDRKQSTKRGHNIYALGIYFERVSEVCADIEKGATPRQAIIAGFNDRLRDFILKSIGEAIATDEEHNNDTIYYVHTK